MQPQDWSTEHASRLNHTAHMASRAQVARLTHRLVNWVLVAAHVEKEGDRRHVLDTAAVHKILAA